MSSTHAVALLSAAQDYTGSWADLGGEAHTFGKKSIALWIENDVNGGANMRVRCLAKHALSATLEYSLPIKSVSASTVSIEENYAEFNVDADAKYVISWELDGLVPKVQFQVSAGTAGTPAAQVDSAYYTMA